MYVEYAGRLYLETDRVWLMGFRGQSITERAIREHDLFPFSGRGPSTVEFSYRKAVLELPYQEYEGQCRSYAPE